MPVIVCFVTVPAKSKARFIAKELIRLRLAACVNIMGSVESHYVWKGTMEKAAEFLLMIKTERSKFRRLQSAVEKLHPYSVPEIIALPVAAVNRSYLNWIQDTVR